MLRWHNEKNRRGGTTVLILLAALLGSAALHNVSAEDNWNVDGENGELHVEGLLLEGACRLDMASAWQQVSLGRIARHTLSKPGERGEPVVFQITLRDCSRTGGDASDRYTGTSTQDAIQPVVTLSFTGVTAPEVPLLLNVNGVSGLGLEITDPNGRQVTPGERGEPLMLVPGDNILTYTVAPVRTTETLTTGAFSALAGFEVSYD